MKSWDDLTETVDGYVKSRRKTVALGAPVDPAQPKAKAPDQKKEKDDKAKDQKKKDQPDEKDKS